MILSLILRRLVVALPLGLAAIVSAPALANDSVYGGCSGTMSGLDGRATCVPKKTNQIALVDEKLTLTQTLQGWEVVALYTLTHTGKTALSVPVGFPVSDPYEPGDEEESETRDTKPPLPDYRVLVDGKKLDFTIFFPANQGDAKAKKAAEDYGYDAVYLVDVPFEPGQTRVLEHRYTHSASMNSIGLHWVNYILRTGGHWKGGTIGRIVANVVMNVPIAPGCHGMSLPGWKWLPESRTMQFEATNWKPTKDLQATWVDANHRAGPETESWAEAADSTFAQLLEGGDALAKAKSPKLLALYEAILGFYRATPGAKPSESIVEGEFCEAGLEYAKPGAADPRLRLDEIEGDVGKLLVMLDAELARRKVAHPALPPR
ncbi:MAG: hypothetical protein IV100_34485 [Myxococcales bacterium]|nr:hypothetical protein [Myxococcales bacterium]